MCNFGFKNQDHVLAWIYYYLHQFIGLKLCQERLQQQLLSEYLTKLHGEGQGVICTLSVEHLNRICIL